MANWDSFWKERPEPINGQDCFFSEETFRKIMGPEPSLEQKLQSLIARLKESKPIKSYNLDLKADNLVNNAVASDLSDTEAVNSTGNHSGKGEKTKLCLSSEASTSSHTTGGKQENETDESTFEIRNEQGTDWKVVGSSQGPLRADVQDSVFIHKELKNQENLSQKEAAEVPRAEIFKSMKEPEVDDLTIGANFSPSTKTADENLESVMTNTTPKSNPENEELCLILPSISDEDEEDENEYVKSNLCENNSGSLGVTELQVNYSESLQIPANESPEVSSKTQIEEDISLLCHPVPYNIPEWSNGGFQGNAYTFERLNTSMETVNEKEWSPDDIPIFSVKEKDSNSSTESSKLSSQKPSKPHEKQPKANNIWSAITTIGTGPNVGAGKTIPIHEHDQTSLTAQQLTSSNSSQNSQKQYRSSLTRAQHKEYMLLFNKFVRPTMLGGKPPALSQADLAKLSVFEVLHQQVSKEQEEYQLYLRQSAKANPQAYSFISKKAKMYSLARAQCHRTDHKVTSKYVEKVPEIEVPLTATSDDGSMKDLIFNKTLQEVGIPPRVTLPELQVGQKQVVIPKNKPQLEAWFPTNREPTERFINHQPVSCDPNARNLASQHSASIVMSSSVLKCLLDNHAPTFDRSWEIVVTVVQTRQGGASEDKIIYLDKPSYQGDLITRDYNNLFHKYALRTFVSHPRNPGSHMPKGMRQGAVNLKRKCVPPEEKAIDDPFDMFSDAADSLETFGGGSKKPFQPTEKVAQFKSQTTQQVTAEIEDSPNITRNEKSNEKALANVETSGIQLKRPQTGLKESSLPECPVKKSKTPEDESSHPSGGNNNVRSTVVGVASPVQKLTRRNASITPKPPNFQTSGCIGVEEAVTLRTMKHALNKGTEDSKITSEVTNKNPEPPPVLRSGRRFQRGENLSSKTAVTESITDPVTSSLCSGSGTSEASVSNVMVLKENETPLVVKKRGRPRKNAQSTIESQHDSMEILSSGQSSTQSFTQPVDSSEKLLNEVSDGKRKRGRPRKNKVKPIEDSHTQQSIKEMTCEQNKEKVISSGDTESPLALQICLENLSCPASPTEPSSPSLNKEGVVTAIPLSPVKVSPKETKVIAALKNHLCQAKKGVFGNDEKVFNPLDSILGPTGPSETSMSSTSCWRDKESMPMLPPYEPCVSIMYNLWELGSLRLLIRCNSHGMLMDSRDGKKPQSVYISPKLEYQPTHGLEQVTLSEVTRAWTSCYIRPHTSLLRARINAFTSEILMFEVLKPAQILQASLPFKPQHAFTVLSNILHHLTGLDYGKYLLSHSSGKEMCRLHKLTVPVDVSFSVPSWSLDAKSVFLHPLQATGRNGTLPWIPIDPTIPTANHVQYCRVPGTFYPKDHTMKDKNPPEKHRGKKGKNRNKQGKKR